MWFNRGSRGSPVRLNLLPHGFTPASLRCLCAMDPESLGKALQDCLQALGTGQGADPPAAPEPQAAAAPPAPHLADKFLLKEEVGVHNTCNPDTTLAPETPEWRWLADVTPKYVFRRALTPWMKKHRQEDKDGVQSYPLRDEVPERRGVLGVEGHCVSVFWGRCVGLLLSCCLLVDCAGVFWSFGRCFDMTHAAFRCCVFLCLCLF